LQDAASGRADVTFQFPDNANHVLKHEARPREALAAAGVMPSYNAAGERLDDEAVAGMLDWLRLHLS